MLGAHIRSVRRKLSGLDRASQRALQQTEHIKVYLDRRPELVDKLGNLKR